VHACIEVLRDCHGNGLLIIREIATKIDMKMEAKRDALLDQIEQEEKAIQEGRETAEVLSAE